MHVCDGVMVWVELMWLSICCWYGSTWLQLPVIGPGVCVMTCGVCVCVCCVHVYQPKLVVIDVLLISNHL